MSDRNRKILVFSTLPIALVVAVVHFATFDSGIRTEPTPQQREMAATAVKQVLAQQGDSIAFEEYEKSPWGRDPFAGKTQKPQIVQTAVDSKPVWRLGGILYGEGTPSAVINGKIVTEGKSIDGAEVIRIKKNEVLIKVEGETKKLSIAGDKS